ncbi:hypothetical protein M426DRAFT_318389 [Hypoxylon sp. CI-4A]|nr:hypothetical protein M426DRAFT_318389 [Hypoxylon sp. CI-4A]
MESLETMQARHRKELRDLQSRITNKKKSATKKTRKGVNDECAELERQLKEKHEQEIAGLNGNVPDEAAEEEGDGQQQAANGTTTTTPADETDEIAQQLQDTSLSQQPPDPNPKSDAEPPTQQQQQQPKKRNRQKERMARRAAEQEAATAAAAEEASNMTDHRTLEKTTMQRTFAAHGLVEKEIQPDGHCLFSAVADQLQTRGVSLASTDTGSDKDTKGKQPAYRVVRQAATEYMQTHPDDFAPFLEEPLDAYARKMRDTAEWGGQLELAALANAYHVKIRVVQDGRTETIEPAAAAAGEKEDGDGDGDGERKDIWLAYYRHGYGLGEHYNSLRQAE